MVRSGAVHAERAAPPVHVLGDGLPEAGSAPSVSEASKVATFPQSYARFSINEKTHRISIKIVDAATDEVLREIPSEEVQRIAEELQALARKTSPGKRLPSNDWGASGGIDRYV
ncbi:MAG: flagellar protein FlaG [Chloroflexi bacterium]|nr:flagellar protein FlaG [Chloroflexota bacterium]